MTRLMIGSTGVLCRVRSAAAWRRPRLLCGAVAVLSLLTLAAHGADNVETDAESSTAEKPVAVAAAASDCGLREGDSLWLVRTRDIFTCDSHAVPATSLVVRQLRDNNWQDADLDGLRTSAEQKLTVVYVHGNRADEGAAIARGSVIYHLLTERPGAPALNVVIWSWPSDKIRGPMRDFRTKAARTDDEAWYLARMLEHLGPRSQVNLAGYSYGARIITGATNLTGGGELYGRRLSDGNVAGSAPSATAAPPSATTPGSSPSSTSSPDSTPLPKHRVVLYAAALHNDWLIEGHFHGESLDTVERMVVLFNPCDPALKRYDRVFPEGCPLALGAYGVADSALGDAGARVEQWNVSSIIGRTHDEWAYLSAPWVGERLRETLLVKPVLEKPVLVKPADSTGN